MKTVKEIIETVEYLEACIADDEVRICDLKDEISRLEFELEICDDNCALEIEARIINCKKLVVYESIENTKNIDDLEKLLTLTVNKEL